MDKKELLERAGDPNHIAGIYNYCDRWCERCPFTSRCLNHAMEEDRKQAAGGADDDNEQFWDQVHDSLQLAMSLLEEMAEEHGIDLDAAGSEADSAPDNKEHVLPHMTRQYVKMAGDWIDLNQEPIAGALERERSHLKVVGPETEKGGVPLSEALEVVNYYKFFIGAKLNRALMGKDDEAGLDLEDMPKDSDGSAKIALIAMDRSISAWGTLAHTLPEQKSRVIEIIGRLNRIRDITEKEFPEARSFIRPGFDE